MKKYIYIYIVIYKKENILLLIMIYEIRNLLFKFVLLLRNYMNFTIHDKKIKKQYTSIYV